MQKRDTTAHNFENQLLNLYLESRATPGISASVTIIVDSSIVCRGLETSTTSGQTRKHSQSLLRIHYPFPQQAIIHSCSFTHGTKVACIISTGTSHNEGPSPTFNPPSIYMHREITSHNTIHTYTSFTGKVSLTQDNTLRGSNLT
jgi:hypothetical protein